MTSAGDGICMHRVCQGRAWHRHRGNISMHRVALLCPLGLRRPCHDVENGVSIVGVNTGRMWASVLNTFLSSGMCSESSNRR